MSAIFSSRQATVASSGLRMRAVPRPTFRSIRTFSSQQESTTVVDAPAQPTPSTIPVFADASASQAPSVQEFKILNDVTEAINGRAAMLGFVAALISEISTNQAVWSQVVGKYQDLELVEKPLGAASLGFAAVVALITVASLAPLMLEGAKVNSKSFGPFTPNLELTLGRVAQMGFFGLVVVEALKGSALF